jgi:hypothetical protein
MKRSILFAVLSILCAAILVIALFVGALLHSSAGAYVIALFVGCLGLLILSLVDFLRDVNLSLAAVTLEMQGIRDYAASEDTTGTFFK